MAMEIAIGIGVVLLCAASVGLTLLTLPGTWLMVLIGIGVKVWQTEMVSWWTIAALLALAGTGEILELFASAVGARRSGGSRAGGVGAIVGGLIGAIAGTPVFPVLGTIIGAVLGAGLGALVVERGMGKRTWRDSARSGVGAAQGRLIATVLKGVIAVVMALTLSVAVFA